MEKAGLGGGGVFSVEGPTSAWWNGHGLGSGAAPTRRDPGERETARLPGLKHPSKTLQQPLVETAETTGGV